MTKEPPIFSRREAEALRRKVGEAAAEALEVLQLELEQFREHSYGLPECWARKFKIVADQIRRDYRLDEPAAMQQPAPPIAATSDDPLAGWRLVSEDEEAA